MNVQEEIDFVDCNVVKVTYNDGLARLEVDIDNEIQLFTNLDDPRQKLKQHINKLTGLNSSNVSVILLYLFVCFLFFFLMIVCDFLCVF